MNKIINPGKFDKKITLITHVASGIDVSPRTKDVWACKESVKRDEFYTSYQSGLKPQIVFKIRVSAYRLSETTDQDGTAKYASQIVFKGTTYDIVRTYETDNLIELVCS